MLFTPYPGNQFKWQTHATLGCKSRSFSGYYRSHSRRQTPPQSGGRRRNRPDGLFCHDLLGHERNP